MWISPTECKTEVGSHGRYLLVEIETCPICGRVTARMAHFVAWPRAPRPLTFSTWAIWSSARLPLTCCWTSFIGDQDNLQQGHIRNAIYSTVTKHTGPFCADVLYTLAPTIETLRPLQQSVLSNLNSALPLFHPLNAQHSLRYPRKVHLMFTNPKPQEWPVLWWRVQH